MSRKKIKADLAIIGAGAAGLVSAAGASMLGRKVVLFESGLMGGDCLNYGCVPSKAILTAAHRVHDIKTAAKLGIQTEEPQVDFAKVRAHIAAAITAIEPNDSQERFESLGVRVIREHARFKDARTLISDSVEVHAKRIVVATGTRARIPPISGLNDVAYLTNETIWSLENLPDHLIILGAGPIGCELGQAFKRLGSKVTLIEAGQPLARFEPDQVQQVTDTLKADGITLKQGVRAEHIYQNDQDIMVELDNSETVSGSHLLIATGREPVFEGLDLELAGVKTDAMGIMCDDKLRTSNKRVYAAGDIAGKGALTHIAGWHGSVIVRNFYFGLPTKQSSQPIPATVYTDPPIASIGLTQAKAKEQFGKQVSVSRFGFEDNDRAIAQGDTRGYAQLVLGKGGAILGAHIVGERADDLIQIVQSVMANGGKVRNLTSAIAPYPTRGEVFKRAAGKYYEPKVFGTLTRILARILTLFH